MTEEKKNPIGRPTKYKPEYCQMLIEHMREGLSFMSFAGVVETNQDTLHEWVKVHKDFSEAKLIAKEISRLWWDKEHISHVTGVGRESVIVKKTIKPNGEVETTYGPAPANHNALRLGITNRFPDQYKDRSNLIVEGGKEPLKIIIETEAEKMSNV